MASSVRVLSTGGTIASTAGEDGAEPSKPGEELIEAVPDLPRHADVSVEQVAQRPSFDMTWEVAADLAASARDAAAAADGVVVTHGTDTMEETAYYLDLALDLDAPIVVTGAQRRPDEPSPDGPANLLAAVRTASDERFRGAGGVYVAANDEVHAARDVTKTHTSALDTFQSPGKGPVAALARDAMRVFRRPGSRSVRLAVTAVDCHVPVVGSGLGVGGAGVERAVRGGADGLVVEGTGLGNTTSALGDAVGSAVDAGVPVVVTSRCQAGTVEPVYGTGGGGRTLRDHGAIFDDDLPAQKARIKLALALERGDDVADLRETFGRGGSFL